MKTGSPYTMKSWRKISILLVMIICLQIAESAVPIIARNLLSTKPRGTVKTIKIEDGDVIDCVDINKQPSLDHPLLKNHTIQMKPTLCPTGLYKRLHDASVMVSETWSANEECPIRTVPIRRTNKRDESDSRVLRKSLSLTQIIHNNDQSMRGNHKYAIVYQRTPQQDRFGVSAIVNVWKPRTEPNDYSAAQLWLGYEEGLQVVESIEVGWQVFPNHYGDTSTRLFVLYTNNGFKSYCYNLDCPGFILVDKSLTPGAKLSGMSSYKGKQYDIDITLYQDMKTKNLWFNLGGKQVGYWPASLFKHLGDGGNIIAWGGEVAEGGSSTIPTTTEMGSGHFPEEGVGGASYMSQLGYLERDRAIFQPDPKTMFYMNTDSSSYRASPLSTDPQVLGTYGSHFFFGGPGRP